MQMIILGGCSCKTTFGGDFTIDWNPIHLNILGLQLVRGGVDGLTQIDLGMGAPPPSDSRRTIPKDIATGLLFVEA